MNRTPIVAGNWKMHKTLHEAHALVQEICELAGKAAVQAQIILCPPFPFLGDTVRALAESDTTLALGAQNCHEQAQGAYTGEVSAPMLASLGCAYCIVGHSERRQYFHESNELLAEKVKACLSVGIAPIYCCGETQSERESGNFLHIITVQITEGLFQLSEEQFRQVVLAYEPVWAIGTGLTASAEQAQEVHAHIRSLIADHFGEHAAAAVRILYGGSVKPANAAELFGQPDIDGGLIGGASLVPADFIAIATAAQTA